MFSFKLRKFLLVRLEHINTLQRNFGSHAYRAVGTALGKNPFPIVIPCHRVVKSNMKIGEYRGGSEMKKEILENEGVRLKGYRII